LYTSNRFVVRAGARLEHVNLTRRFSLDPRFSLAYKIGADGQVSFAYGKFRQSAKDEFIKVDPLLGAEKASHYIFNYQYVKSKRTFRVETYYKSYSDLVKYPNDDPIKLTNEGTGAAKGLELFWRDYGSINLLIIGSPIRISIPSATTSIFPMKRHLHSPPNTMCPSLQKYFVQKIKSQLGVTYSFTSGRPYNDPNTNTFNQLKTPYYADLSFNWSYLPTTSVIVYFSCTNVLGRDNIFGYEV
jgi:outer membrane cobalamin receptor